MSGVCVCVCVPAFMHLCVHVSVCVCLCACVCVLLCDFLWFELLVGIVIVIFELCLNMAVYVWFL